MAAIIVTRPSEHAVDELGVKNWDVWTCEVSTFDWHYDQKETFYMLAGKVVITCGDEQVAVQAGDLVICPAGLDCAWEVQSPVKKHYRFG